MPFVSQPYMASLSADQHRSLVSAHTNIGYHPETYDELHIPQIDRYAGTYVLGVQGSGKSGLMQNLIVADMQAGHAVTVIDPHGDLTAACLHHVPPERMQDVFLLDMEDEGFPFGVNIFSTGKLTSSACCNTSRRTLNAHLRGVMAGCTEPTELTSLRQGCCYYVPM